MQDELRRWATVGSGVAELVLNRAEQFVKELVREGEIQREAASGLVRDLLERTLDDREEVARALRAEIQNQTAQLGIASAREVERLEGAVARLTDRLDRLEAQPAGSPTKASTGTTRKKTTRKKSSGKKTTRKKSSGKKSTGKKTTRKRSSSGKKGTDRSAPGQKPASGQSRGS
ncbi:MAG: hypothetical protein H0W55_06545 [Actinobacteria bacterium]|nr:hypothetical protein [Actinomycetota bacterium]